MKERHAKNITGRLTVLYKLEWETKEGREMISKKIMVVVVVVLIAMFFIITHSESAPAAYSFSVSLVAKSKVDDSLTNLLDHATWYQWLYKVQVNEGESIGHAVSHFLIKIPECYGLEYLTKMGDSSGANQGSLYGTSYSGNELRSYVVEHWIDGQTNIRGLKWEDIVESAGNEEIDEVGEAEYFWFSAPTAEGQEGTAAIKFGQESVTFLVETPVCPGGGDPSGEPVIVDIAQ